MDEDWMKGHHWYWDTGLKETDCWWKIRYEGQLAVVFLLTGLWGMFVEDSISSALKFIITMWGVAI